MLKTVWRKDFITVISKNPLVTEKLEVVGHKFCWSGPTTSNQCRQNPDVCMCICSLHSFVCMYVHMLLYFILYIHTYSTYTYVQCVCTYIMYVHTYVYNAYVRMYTYVQYFCMYSTYSISHRVVCTHRLASLSLFCGMYPMQSGLLCTRAN